MGHGRKDLGRNSVPRGKSPLDDIQAAPDVRYELLWEAQRSKPVRRALVTAMLRAPLRRTKLPPASTPSFTRGELIAAIRTADYMRSRSAALRIDASAPKMTFVEGGEKFTLPLFKAGEPRELSRWQTVLDGLLRSLLVTVSHRPISKDDLAKGRRAIKTAWDNKWGDFNEEFEGKVLSEIRGRKARRGRGFDAQEYRIVAAYELLSICRHKNADLIIRRLMGHRLRPGSVRKRHYRHRREAMDHLFFMLLMLSLRLPGEVVSKLKQFYAGELQGRDFRAVEVGLVNSLTKLAPQ